MKLKLKKLSLDAGRPIAFISEETAKKLDVHVGDRIEVANNGRKIISIVDIIKGFIKEGEISLSTEITNLLGVSPGKIVDIRLAFEPYSLSFISKKMNGQELKKDEIYSIVQDIVKNALTEAEIAYFVLATKEKGMNLKETIYLTEAMYRTGQKLSWPAGYKIADKHCIGGIPGNRTTPIVVSICAACGIVMPKTSSRAITSAAGTADTIESIATVDISSSRLKNIVQKTGACLAWGGSLGLAPADDKIIRIERILNLDPESQLIASILSKKLAAGSKYILIDIPYGVGAKVSKLHALKIKKRFLQVGKHFNLKIKVVLTSANQPIGNGIGPILEMIDVIKVLQRNNSPKDLERKSIMLAGEILEMTGKTKKGNGKKLAQQTLNSGKAWKKFEEIINEQGRTNGKLETGEFSHTIKANRTGKVKLINNKTINHLARILGCPVDKGAGIYLYEHINDIIKKNDPLLTFYSESSKKLNEAIEHFYIENPILIGGKNHN